MVSIFLTLWSVILIESAAWFEAEIKKTIA
jgi:hypothetical protein